MARQGHEFVDSQNVAREKLRKEYVSKKWHGGKGSSPRPGYYSQQYKDNYDKIFGNKKHKTEIDSAREKSKTFSSDQD
jgi:hypothetical protein